MNSSYLLGPKYNSWAIREGGQAELLAATAPPASDKAPDNLS